MNEGRTHFPWATTPSDRRRAQARVQARPADRVALWAVFLALFAIVVGASTANADGGGVSAGGPSSSAGTGGGGRASATNSAFGARPLRKGDKGDDVKTLNWILGALPFASGVSAGARFDGATDQTVREFQQNISLGTSGVVDKKTRTALIGSMSSAPATYYELFGNRTACGQRISKSTIGVANNTLPCGTKITFAYKSRVVRATVIDTGGFGCSPYFDLTYGLKQALRFPGSGSVKYAVAGGRAAC